MKHLRYILILTLGLIAAACTHNDGDIGSLFGSWRIDSYTADGIAVDGKSIETVAGTTISFQNSVVMINVVTDDLGSNTTRYGSWSEQDDVLTLDFCHSDNDLAQGTSIYSAPEWLGMTSQTPMNMAVTNRTSKSMTLTWTDLNGSIKIYKISKTW